jgi:hypothetical protein
MPRSTAGNLKVLLGCEIHLNVKARININWTRWGVAVLISFYMTVFPSQWGGTPQRFIG